MVVGADHCGHIHHVAMLRGPLQQMYLICYEAFHGSASVTVGNLLHNTENFHMKLSQVNKSIQVSCHIDKMVKTLLEITVEHWTFPTKINCLNIGFGQTKQQIVLLSKPLILKLTIYVS